MERHSDENPTTPHHREPTFWDHLEDLRWVILRSAIVVVVCMVLVFANKDLVTGIIFAPQNSNFVVYRGLCYLANAANFPDLCPDSFSIKLINTRLAAPFFAHMTASLYLGLLLALPIVLFILWRYVAPALYPRERKLGVPFLCASIVLFATGVALGYFLIFPLALRFLGTYQFGDIIDTVDLTSYMSFFYTSLFTMGVVFEMPILAYTLSRLGLISKELLKQYRKYAIVIIFIVGAIITPTSDPFTLMLVSIPMYLLYMLSIRVAKSGKREEE